MKHIRKDSTSHVMIIHYYSLQLNLEQKWCAFDKCYMVNCLEIIKWWSYQLISFHWIPIFECIQTTCNTYSMNWYNLLIILMNLIDIILWISTYLNDELFYHINGRNLIYFPITFFHVYHLMSMNMFLIVLGTNMWA